MIIWIDGANGIGKSHVAAKLAEVFSDSMYEKSIRYRCFCAIIYVLEGYFEVFLRYITYTYGREK